VRSAIRRIAVRLWPSRNQAYSPASSGGASASPPLQFRARSTARTLIASALGGARQQVMSCVVQGVVCRRSVASAGKPIAAAPCGDLSCRPSPSTVGGGGGGREGISGRSGRTALQISSLPHVVCGRPDELPVGRCSITCAYNPSSAQSRRGVTSPCPPSCDRKRPRNQAMFGNIFFVPSSPTRSGRQCGTSSRRLLSRASFRHFLDHLVAWNRRWCRQGVRSRCHCFLSTRAEYRFRRSSVS